MRLIKKVLKIIVVIALLILVGLLIAMHQFLKPETDAEIIEKLRVAYTNPTVYHKKYDGYEYREVQMQKHIDTILPILVFVHGSPGSIMDFERYLKDSLLNAKSNMIAYERIGYGPKNLGKTPASMEVELGVLHDVVKNYPKEKVVLAGYSYGGPVVLASNEDYKYKVSMASAVVGEYEPMFKALKFYDWKLTRWLVPPKARSAAKEKYAHLKEFPNYKDKWNLSPSKIINIHGSEDWIVPYKNSEYLQKVIDDDKFTMVTIDGAGHDLIWSNFNLIKTEILKALN